MRESKIETTDRLRKDGLWAEASLYRDEAKACLRDEGLTRKEANEISWQAMLNKYPAVPPEIEELVYILLAAAFPPLGGKDDPGEEALFRDVWFVHHLVRALTFYRTLPNEMKPAAHLQIAKSLREDVPKSNAAATYTTMVMAFVDPQRFWDNVAKETLSNRLKRILGDDSVAGAQRAELEWLLEQGSLVPPSIADATEQDKPLRRGRARKEGSGSLAAPTVV